GGGRTARRQADHTAIENAEAGHSPFRLRKRVDDKPPHLTKVSLQLCAGGRSSASGLLPYFTLCAKEVNAEVSASVPKGRQVIAAIVASCLERIGAFGHFPS